MKIPVPALAATALAAALLAPLATAPAATAAETSARDTLAAPVASRPGATVKDISEIQSKRWVPKSLYANEIIIRNGFDRTIFLADSRLMTNETVWHHAPPKSIAPGQTVTIAAQGQMRRSVSSSFGVTYRIPPTAREKQQGIGPRKFSFSTSNREARKNTYTVDQSSTVRSAMVDNYNNAWIPRSGERSTVGSGTIGKGNWAVVALEISGPDSTPGTHLPRGSWSDGACDSYKTLIANTRYSFANGGVTGWYQNGATGAHAGALIGWLAHSC